MLGGLARAAPRPREASHLQLLWFPITWRPYHLALFGARSPPAGRSGAGRASAGAERRPKKCFSTEFASAAERPARRPREASQQIGAPAARRPTRARPRTFRGRTPGPEIFFYLIIPHTPSDPGGGTHSYSENRLPDVLQTSRDFHGALSSIADPAVTTRGSVILTLRAQTAM